MVEDEARESESTKGIGQAHFAGRGIGSRCERLHRKFDDGDRRDVEQLECVHVLQPVYEVVGCQCGDMFAMPILNTWGNLISHRCPPIQISV